MGRRKIEIKPIRDDRNRSVTFLKRKGGLFKKAHELSVLCQVDVAVIIFGHNKKLCEYSSSDINDVIGRFQYYGGAHEHKGPQDFADKGGDDDDDEDDVGDEGDQRGTPQPDHHMSGMQHHPSFQHVRQGTPQQSPPMHNGQMPPFQRGPSPLPQNLSRPSSRAEQHQGHFRRASSNLVPPQHAQQAQMPPQNYAYQPNAQFYNAQAAAQMQRPPGPPGPPGPPPPGSTYPPPYQPQAAQHPQMQQVMMQDARRSSMPPAFAPQPPPQANMQRQDHLQTPPQPQPQRSPRVQQLQRATPSPQPPHQQFASPPVHQPRALPAHAKSQSMFTPIDDSRSMLAQHWGSTSNAEPPRSEPAIKSESGPRSASVDIAAMDREKAGLPAKANGVPSPARRAINKSPSTPQRTASMPTAAGPQRVVAGQAEPKRPRLKVQIPSEQSGDEGGTASAPDETSSQPKESASNDPSANTNTKPPHGVVLPPPSPSTNALLSAGAQGPPNPFARPAPPMSTNPHAMNRDAAPTNNNNIETPISALPSRFMSDNLLPSPSTFYPEWGFGRGGGGGTDSASNMLPSPLNFQTPVLPMGGSGSWRDESSGNGKRAGEGGEESEAKRTKT